MFQFDTNCCHAIFSTGVVIIGELKHMARKSERTSENRQRIHALLAWFKIREIDHQTAGINSDLKSTILNTFGPKEKARRRTFKFESLGFTDNDCWVAASAIRHDEILLTADRDVLRIASNTSLQVDQWWFPTA